MVHRRQILRRPARPRSKISGLATAWRQPDEGIWEVRGGRQHFVYSKVMAWVAFDRAASELEAQVYQEPGRRWRRNRRDALSD
jgi:GH15 family glucan-1,4-alpha-glucosidase